MPWYYGSAAQSEIGAGTGSIFVLLVPFALLHRQSSQFTVHSKLHSPKTTLDAKTAFIDRSCGVLSDKDDIKP
jgi:hypothetical protein